MILAIAAREVFVEQWLPVLGQLFTLLKQKPPDQLVALRGISQLVLHFANDLIPLFEVPPPPLPPKIPNIPAVHISTAILVVLTEQLWIYLLRLKGESNQVTEVRIRAIVDAIFPTSGRLTIVDGQLDIFVQMITVISVV